MKGRIVEDENAIPVLAGGRIDNGVASESQDR